MGLTLKDGRVIGKAADLYREGYLREGTVVSFRSGFVSDSWAVTEDHRTKDGAMAWKHLGSGSYFRVHVNQLTRFFSVDSEAEDEL